MLRAYEARVRTNLSSPMLDSSNAPQQDGVVAVSPAPIAAQPAKNQHFWRVSEVAISKAKHGTKLQQADPSSRRKR
jgi:hypothetical protein